MHSKARLTHKFTQDVLSSMFSMDMSICLEQRNNRCLGPITQRRSDEFSHAAEGSPSPQLTPWALVATVAPSFRGVREMPMLFRNSTGSMPLSWRGSSIPLLTHTHTHTSTHTHPHGFTAEVVVVRAVNTHTHTPDRRGLEGPADPREVLVSVPDGLGEGGVVGEEGLGAGARVSERILLLHTRGRLLQHGA